MSVKKIIAAFFVTTLLSAAFASPAFAYSTTGYKLNSQIWYQASEVFTGTTREGFRSAMSTWNQLLPSNKRLCYDQTTHDLRFYPNNNSLNRIYKTYSGSNRYLAENSVWYNTSTRYVSESDVDINANYSWWNGAEPGRYDVQSVFLHEMGHSVGLSHSTQPVAVMYSTMSTNMVKRILQADDINGVKSLY